MEVERQEDVMPSDFTSPTLLGNFLDWTVSSWDEGERAWFNMYVGLCLYEPRMTSGAPAILAASRRVRFPGIAFYPSTFAAGHATLTKEVRISP